MDISELLINLSFKSNLNEFPQTKLAVHNSATVRSEDLNEQILIGPAFINIQESEKGYTLNLANSFECPLYFVLDLNMKTESEPKRVRIQIPESVKQQIDEQNKSVQDTTSINYVKYQNEFSFDGTQLDTVKSTEKYVDLIWDGRKTSTPYIKHRIVTKIDTNDNIAFKVDFFDITDINMDGQTDKKDAEICLANWNTAEGDVNLDGTTDSQDVSIIMSRWETHE
jgi:hypothetical protein